MDDDIFSLTDETVFCFCNHELVGKTAQEMCDIGEDEYTDGWICDSCEKEEEEFDAPFDRCILCERDYCDECSERSESFI